MDSSNQDSEPDQKASARTTKRKVLLLPENISTSWLWGQRSIAEMHSICLWSIQWCLALLEWKPV